MLRWRKQPEIAPLVPTTEVTAEEALHVMFNAGVALFGHGAEEEDVTSILHEGLWVKSDSLRYTSNMLMNPAKDQTNMFYTFDAQLRGVKRLFEDWPGNRYTSDFRDIILVGVQTTGREDAHKTDVILPHNEAVQTKWGRPYEYVVSPIHIPGYINTDRELFCPNRFHHFEPVTAPQSDARSSSWTIASTQGVLPPARC
jgi:hypothetical protein